MTTSPFDILKPARHFTMIGCLVIGMAIALPACSAVNVAKNDKSSSDFRDLELRFAQLKGTWLSADADLLAATCQRMTPAVRSRMVPETSDFDVRKTACADIPALRMRVAKLLKAADAADDGAAFEAVQTSLEKERQTADAAIQGFPTSSFAESNFPSGAASEFRAKHESEAADAGAIAASAVEVARAASETALSQAKHSDHQLDKSRAEIADENYSKASAELKNLGSVASAPQIVASVGDMLTTVDWVLGTAESTTSRETSPVSEAHEDLPTAATPVPVVVAAVTTSTSAPPSYSSSNDAQTTQSSSGANVSGSAVEMVQNYYRLWNAREYRTMYQMLSQRMQQKYPYDKYVKYHDFVQHIDVEATQGDSPRAVNVRITSQDRDKNGVVTAAVNEGEWLLSNDNGQAHLDAEDVHEVK